MPRVLISDALSPRAVEIFHERGVDTDVMTGLTPDDLKKIIGKYDGLAVRSATKVTKALLEQAENLKVIGRAGIGVDNIDVPAATQRGIVVMNTPFGNSITTAEHAIALMFALARQLPAADRSTQAGKWDKARFMGGELTGKTLGVIGCGSIVADRAVGLKMKVIAYDPFLSAERAVTLGVEKVALDDLLARADFITLHTPLTDATRHLIDAKALAKTKKGVRIINCARGGLIVEEDLKAALDSGHVAGAALDVFPVEPAKENALFGRDDVVATPHLGAATTEAQENVALQIAEQMSDYLITGAVTNALNVKPLTSIVLTELLAPQLDTVNMVNAPVICRERDIRVSETRVAEPGNYHTLIRVTVVTERRTRTIAGTLFGGDRPRIVEIEGVPMEAELGAHMLFVRNKDKPGFIGNLGRTMGEAEINIATFHLGRAAPGGDAICLVQVDQALSDDVLECVRAIPNVLQARSLRF